MVEFKVETLIEEYEWLVSFKANDDKASEASLVYVVSINFNDIDWKKCSVNYIHIENIDYLYNISGGDERIIEIGYDIFRVIEREVIEEIKSL